MKTRQEINIEEETKMRFVSPEDYQDFEPKDYLGKVVKLKTKKRGTFGKGR